MDGFFQYYAVWKQFNLKTYQYTLTSENVLNNGNEKFIDIVQELIQQSDGNYQVNEDKLIQTKCIQLEKNGHKYLLPSQWQNNLPINVKSSFDCFLKQSDKTVYKFITKPISVKITGDKILSFKDLITVFNPMIHSEHNDWTFLKIQAIATKAKGAKYRLCSEPACGKNANDIILHLIFNDNLRVAKPTLAKLETLFYYNQKVIPDELTSLQPNQIREVEPFFLTLADEAPTFQKHSMAQKKDLNEVDISQASCIFTYNTRSCLGESGKFFDDLWTNYAAFESRYPAFLVKGTIIQEIPKLSTNQAKNILSKNETKLRNIAKCIKYYMDNMTNELHHYDRSKCKLKGRHMSNTQAVIDGLDVYSENQTEFDSWLEWINNSIDDYKLINKKEEDKDWKGMFKEEQV